MTATASEQTQDATVEIPAEVRTRRGRRPLVVVAVVAVVCALGGGWLWSSHRNATTVDGVAPSSVPTIAHAKAGRASTAAPGASRPPAGSQGTAVVPVPTYFTGPDPFVPKIAPASGSSTNQTSAGG